MTNLNVKKGFDLDQLNLSGRISVKKRVLNIFVNHLIEVETFKSTDPLIRRQRIQTHRFIVVQSIHFAFTYTRRSNRIEYRFSLFLDTTKIEINEEFSSLFFFYLSSLNKLFSKTQFDPEEKNFDGFREKTSKHNWFTLTNEVVRDRVHFQLVHIRNSRPSKLKEKKKETRMTIRLEHSFVRSFD